MKNAILEIGVEEIPARFMPGFLKDLKEKAEKELNSSKLKFKQISTLGTARRLVLSITGLSLKQEDVSEEKKGPPKDRAFGKDGKPNQAAIGFAKSLGLEVEDLKIKKINGNEYLFARHEIKGQMTEKILSHIFPNIISSLYLPISMKWGANDFKFIRPIHWILALFGEKTVNFELAGIKSSSFTFGHRYVDSKKALKIKNPAVFEKTLLKNGVLLDQEKRRNFIKEQVQYYAKKAGGSALSDDLLLDEVTYLVENPSVAKGSFDKSYLILPKDILITTMKKNQKYFPVLDSKGELKPNFVFVTDCPDKNNAQATADGNERVLSARLADAKFFYDEDVKTALASRVDDLKKVMFYKKLGTMYEKISRVKDLSLFILKELKTNDNRKANIARIAELCKADLVTKMVFEFPELQGVMGREYAASSGENEIVSTGIFEHYLPRFSGDELPKNIESSIVSIADKIDSIIGYFCVGLVPSGSQDPYALRRQAQGIIEIILGNNMEISLEGIIERSYKLYEPVFMEYLFNKGESEYKDFARIQKAVLDFLAQRLRGYMLNNKIQYDVADAALSNFSDPIFAFENAKLIMKHLKSDLLKGIVMTSDRVSRIAKEAKKEQVVEADFIDNEEKKLNELYMKVNWEVGSAIDSGNNEKALNELSKMTDPVETFFDKVMVMDKNEKLKTNRLALLKSIELMYLSLADFPKIVIQK